MTLSRFQKFKPLESGSLLHPWSAWRRLELSWKCCTNLFPFLLGKLRFQVVTSRLAKNIAKHGIEVVPAMVCPALKFHSKAKIAWCSAGRNWLKNPWEELYQDQLSFRLPLPMHSWSKESSLPSQFRISSTASVDKAWNLYYGLLDRPSWSGWSQTLLV